MTRHNDPFIEIPTAGAAPRKITYDITRGNGSLNIFWLCGFLSDMRSRKASALADWCGANDITLTRFNYSGRGTSDGRVEDGTISQWLEETLAVFTEKTQGPQFLIGSSMGGWLALLLMKALSFDRDSFSGCALIAPAWNMTEAIMWDRFPPAVRDEIEQNGVYHLKSDYGSCAITKQLIEDGRQHLVRPEELTINCPVTILHGMRDDVVPWQHSLELTSRINGEDTVLQLIKNGDHSLASDQNIARLFNVVLGMTKG